ncbi:MAG: hypothetical protein IIC94_09545 [Chloroflexi bacterium]|nr:hypothetical protein [Chloroflexota bacterium]
MSIGEQLDRIELKLTRLEDEQARTQRKLNALLEAQSIDPDLLLPKNTIQVVVPWRFGRAVRSGGVPARSPGT